MADEDIVGIIRVPLNAYTYESGKGREEDPAIVEHLSEIFEVEGCKPDLWEHHIKGEIDTTTYSKLLIALGLSEDKFRSTVQTGKYPELLLRKRIICLDGRQRIAAAWERFGERFWWPVKLYRSSHMSRALHQTKYPDGEICWHLFRLALGKADRGGDWGFDLSESKIKNLNLLLRRENGVFTHEDIVEALCAVLEFPGTRRRFKLGTVHHYTPLSCSKEIAHYLYHMSSIYWHVIAHDASMVPYMDSRTFDCLEGRNPSNKVDRDYIQLVMHTGDIFQGVKNESVRQDIQQALLSLNLVFPTFKTFHQNMLYFSVGAKILRDHIIDNPGKIQDEDDRDRDEGLFQSLRRCWTPPDKPRIEVSEGAVEPLVSLDVDLACILLFLDGQRDCLYLSNEPFLILQDKRGEPAPVAAVDTWYVSRLQARARLYGFHSNKINRGLTATPQSPRRLGKNLYRSGRIKKWRGGKPSIRNFLNLQRNAYLPNLEQADSQEKVTAAFVQKDFLEAFFGPWSYVTGGPEIPSNLPSFPGGDKMQIDEEDCGPPPEDPMQVDEAPPPPEHGQRTAPNSQGQERHQTQVPQARSPMQLVEPLSQISDDIYGISPPKTPASATQQTPSITPAQNPSVDQDLAAYNASWATTLSASRPITGPGNLGIDHINPPETRASALDPALQVDRESVLAAAFENTTRRGDSSRNSRYKPARRRDSKPRSKSPSRSPISRNRRERPKINPSRSPIRPPSTATVSAAVEEFAIHSLQNPQAQQPPAQSSSPLARENSASLPHEPSSQTQDTVGQSIPPSPPRDQESIRNHRSKPSRRDRSRKPRSKSPRFRRPTSRTRRERSRAGPSRSPILPPGRPSPVATPRGAEQPEDASLRRSPIQPPNSIHAAIPNPSPSAYERPTSQLQLFVLDHIAPQQTTEHSAQDENNRNIAHRTGTTSSGRFNPLKKPDRVKPGPSKRSPIRLPESVILPSLPGAAPPQDPPRSEQAEAQAEPIESWPALPESPQVEAAEPSWPALPESPQAEPAVPTPVEPTLPALPESPQVGPELSHAEPASIPTQQTITPPAAGVSRIVRQREPKLSNRFDPTKRPERVRPGPSKRSPIQPPSPRPEAQADLPHFHQPELADPPTEPEGSAQQTTNLYDAGRSIVRRQRDAKNSSRFDPTKRPVRAKSGSSKRSPIPAPESTLPSSPPVREPSSGSQTYPPGRPSSEPSAFTGGLQASRLQELEHQTADVQRTTERRARAGDRSRSRRREPPRQRDSGSHSRPRGRSRSRSPSSRSPGSRNRGNQPTGGASRSPITRPRPPPRNCSPPRAVRTEGSPSRRSQIYPPSQSQAPRVPEIPEIPSTFADARRASQARTANTQQATAQDEERSQSNRRKRPRQDSRSRSRNRRERPDGPSRSPIAPPEFSGPIRRPPGADAAGKPSKRSRIAPPSQPPRRDERLLSQEPQTPRRSERIRLLSQEPQTPRRSARIRLLSQEPQTPRRSARIHLFNHERQTPQRSARKSLRGKRGAGRQKALRTKSPKREWMKNRPAGLHQRSILDTPPRADSPVRWDEGLLEEEQSAPPLEEGSAPRDGKGKGKAAQNPRGTYQTGDLPCPAGPPREEGSAPRDRKGKGKAVPNALGIYQADDLPCPPAPPLEEGSAPRDRKGKGKAAPNALGIHQAGDLPCPPAPPREEGSARRNRKGKGKAVQDAAEWNANQPEHAAKRAVSRPIDPADFAMMSRPKASSTRRSQAQSSRSPVRPPGSASNSPSMSSRQPQQGSAQHAGALVERASGEESIRGPTRSPIPRPSFVDSRPQETQTFSESKIARHEESLYRLLTDSEEEEL